MRLSTHLRVGTWMGAGFASGLLAAGCDSTAPSSAKAAAAPSVNVVLITLDTTRADHCTFYGYSRPTTPHLQALAEAGAVFDAAYAPMPTTAPSHATIMTGQLPDSHRLLNNGQTLAAEAETLAERLSSAGYQTAAFVSAFPLHQKFGLDQGFDVYDDGADLQHLRDMPSQVSGQMLDPERLRRQSRNAEATTARARHWLRTRNNSSPYFLWVHYFDPHDIYQPPEPFRSQFLRDSSREDKERLIDLYDGELAYTDAFIQQLWQEVEAVSAARETLLVVTSDHGEGLHDHHDWLRHGVYLYEEAMRAVLFFRWPGEIPAAKRVDQLASLSDVAATILDLVNLSGESGEPFANPYSRSLRPLWFGARLAERPAYLRRTVYQKNRVFGVDVTGSMLAVRSGPYKLIHQVENDRNELYDLQEDPREQVNRAAELPEVVADLKGLIDNFLRDHDPVEASGWDSLSQEDREQLRALGYAE